MIPKYVNYYDESNYLARIVLGDRYYRYYKNEEYSHRQSGKNPKSLIIMSEKMKKAGYRLVFFTTREESSIRFDKINSVGDRGRNLIPECLENVDPHEYTTDECVDIFNNIKIEFMRLSSSEE